MENNRLNVAFIFYFSTMEKMTVWCYAKEIYRKISVFPLDVDPQFELLSSTVMFLLHSLFLCTENSSAYIDNTKILLFTTLKNRLKNQVYWKSPINVDMATKEIRVIHYQ